MFDPDTLWPVEEIVGERKTKKVSWYHNLKYCFNATRFIPQGREVLVKWRNAPAT
jgi:hypothetical protein